MRASRLCTGRHLLGERPTSLSDAYAVAAIELYSRLWLALERLAVCEDEDSQRFETAVITLRLELVVLLDACDSHLWRSMLRPENRIQLQATLRSVLRILMSERVDDWCGVFLQAQDHLLDAVLAQCSCTPHLVRSCCSDRDVEASPTPRLSFA